MLTSKKLLEACLKARQDGDVVYDFLHLTKQGKSYDMCHKILSVNGYLPFIDKSDPDDLNAYENFKANSDNINVKDIPNDSKEKSKEKPFSKSKERKIKKCIGRHKYNRDDCEKKYRDYK